MLQLQRCPQATSLLSEPVIAKSNTDFVHQSFNCLRNRCALFGFFAVNSFLSLSHNRLTPCFRMSLEAATRECSSLHIQARAIFCRSHHDLSHFFSPRLEFQINYVFSCCDALISLMLLVKRSLVLKLQQLSK